MALEMIARKGVLMSKTQIQNESNGVAHVWLTTFAIMFLSLFGVILALITIYALPDQTVRPSIGALFYVCCAGLMSIFLFFRWKKEKVFENHSLLNVPDGKATIFIKETVSDKIIKWLVTIYSIFFVFSGISISLICIYALPDKTVQPKVSILFYLGGAIVLGSFIFVVWKNWVYKRP